MANTIADKLTYLNGTKDAIKQAIIGKGVDVSDTDTFRSYADKISSIQTGGGTTNIPDGTKFGYSTFTTVPDSIFPYLETQNSMGNMFVNCSSLQTVPLFDTANVNDMHNMFSYCTSLQTLSLFDTSNVTIMNSMFYNCSSLQTVPLFNTSNVDDMNSMFNGCNSLQTVPLFDTANVNDMGYMFSNCKSLQTIPLFDTANVTIMNSMFYNCKALETVPLFDTSNVTRMNSMFNGCTSLTNLGGLTGLKIDLDLSSSPLLTADSIVNVINNAKDMSSSPKTLTLHQDVFNKLSEEQIATASAKGWNIAAA